jgi:hypothetical protein
MKAIFFTIAPIRARCGRGRPVAAEAPEQPHHPRDVVGVVPALDEAGEDLLQIGALLRELAAGPPITERHGDRREISAVFLLVSGHGVGGEPTHRVLLPLRPQALTADVRRHGRQHVHAGVREHEEEEDDDDERQDDRRDLAPHRQRWHAIERRQHSRYSLAPHAPGGALRRTAVRRSKSHAATNPLHGPPIARGRGVGGVGPPLR